MMPASGLGLAHAKAILIGEHFVLDGVEAVALALGGMTTEVRWRHDDGPLRLRAGAADGLDDAGRHAAVAMLHRAAEAAAIAPRGAIEVASSVPVGRGLGSSAAFAVAALRAAREIAAAPGTDRHRQGEVEHVDAARHDPLDDAWLLAAARRVESLVHGQSSGLDPAAAMAGGGAIAYARGAVLERIDPAPTAALRAARWLIADAGPAPATAVAIARADAARVAMGTSAASALGERVQRASELAREGLRAGDTGAVAAAMNDACDALTAIDVTDARIDALVARLRAGGALAAKQSGAGLGGAVLALAPNAAIANTLHNELAADGVASWTLEICR